MSYTQSRSSHRLVMSIRSAAVLYILLHLASALLTENAAWGLWPIMYLPPIARYVLALLALAVALGGEWAWERADSLRSALNRVAFTSPPVRLLIALVAGVFFYLFRIRHLRWGDAELLVKALVDPYRLTYVWQAPLDVYLHAKGWQIGNALFGWPDPIPVYRILSTLAGVFFVWVLIGLVARMGRNRTERVLTFGLVLTLGTIELFCGYIENYPLMTLGVLVYLLLALRYLRGEIPLVLPAAALAVTHAFHPSTIILAPSLLYLLSAPLSVRGGNVQDSQDVLTSTGRRVTALSLLSIAVPYLFVFAAVVALMTTGQHGLDALVGVDFPGGGDRSWFVPLSQITTEWQHYTMFSVGHLLDIVNQQLLVAPLVWPALVLTALFAWPRLRGADGTGRFLLVAAGLYLLLTLVWNADYGGQKDWDLFSPAAIPAALLLGWALPRALPERVTLRKTAWALIAVQGFHLLAWLWQNTRPQ